MKRALVALLLLSSVAEAQTAAFRAGSGLQLNTIASRPTTIAGRRTLWIDTSNRLRFYNGTDDTYPSTIAATTKGDLSVFTGSTWGRLAAGTNNYCLVADSAQTTGLKWATCAAATGYQTIEDEGSGLTARTILNFIGSGVSCVDNAGATRTDCTISSGGSTGNWTFASDAADDSGANVLTIGATTATGVTLSRSAGTITMAGATVFGANKGITATAGTGAFDFSGGTGVFKTSTGASTFGGSSNTFSSGAIGPASGQQHTLPAVTSDTFALLGATQTLAAKTLTAPVINGATSSGSTSVDFSGNSGTFKTTTGASTFGGSSNTFTNSISAPGGIVSHMILPTASQTYDLGSSSFYWRKTYSGDFDVAPAAVSSGLHTSFLYTGATDTGLTAGTENPDFYIDLNRNVTWAAGAIATQRSFVITAPTLSFASASTVTNAATLAVTAAPVQGGNATLTNKWALWVQAGLTQLSGSLVTPSVGATAATLHVVPNVTADTFALLAASQTLTNKTLTSPTISGPTLSGSVVGTYNIAGTPTATSPIMGNLGATTVAPTWTAITYSNSWVDFGASSTSRYSKNATGQVTLEIRCKNGSSATAAINSGTPIAAGYRPGQVVQICGQTLAGGIACGDLDTGGVFTPSVSSTSGIFLRAQYFAEN